MEEVEARPGRSGAQRLIAGALALAAVMLCGLMAINSMQLASMGAPWAYVGSTLDPNLIPTRTPYPTLTPSPSPSPTPEPTVTALALAAEHPPGFGPAMIPSGPCIQDRVGIVSLGAVDGAGHQGYAAVLVDVFFCLQSRPEAVVMVGIVPTGLSANWQALQVGNFTEAGSPSLVQRGDGRLIMVLEWRSVPPGSYWLVAALADRRSQRVLAFGPGPQFTVSVP